MTTLLLRLAGPLQSWGIGSKFNQRSTERAPTKSAIIGLLASALGRKRHESIQDLTALRFGTRVDWEGALLRDYHMVHKEKFWITRNALKDSDITERYYLADASFLVGLEGDEDLLQRLETAVQNPRFPLFLGRRSCPPEGRVCLGLRLNKSLEEALREEPWLASAYLQRKAPSTVQLRLVLDAAPDSKNAYFQRDMPESFDQKHRKHGYRSIDASQLVSIPNPSKTRPCHDAMASLEEHF